jgi:hypothetical protein
MLPELTLSDDCVVLRPVLRRFDNWLEVLMFDGTGPTPPKS